MLWPWTCFAAIGALAPSLVEALTNLTVDDTSSQIIYSPADAWKVGASCGRECSAKVSQEGPHDGTWREGLFSTTGSTGTSSFSNQDLFLNFSFFGSAIYAFGITPSSDLRHHTDSFSSLTFWIDDELVGNYTNYPSAENQANQFNVSWYSNTSLLEGQHLFSIRNGPVTGAAGTSIALFDYLVYSRESEGTSSSPSASGSTNVKSNSHTAAIAGGVLGASAFVLLIAAGYLLWQRRQVKGPSHTSHEEAPSSSPPFSKLRAWLASVSGKKPLTFNPDMMTAPRTANLTGPSPLGSRPSPSGPIHPTQNRILAWQRQTAEATAVTGGVQQQQSGPTSERLSSYWDQSTESYRSWEARATSPDPPPVVQDYQTPPPEKAPLASPALASPIPAPSPAQVAGSSTPLPSPVQTPRTSRKPPRRFTVMNN